MWYENDPSIINAESIECRETNIVFEHHYLNPISPSKRKFKRDFIIEKKRSFDIAGIDFHSYRDSLYVLGKSLYDGMSVELEDEPWNEYDPNAIVIRLLGRKLGYIRRYDTEEVSEIMTFSKRYWVTLDCSCMGWERINISYLQEFHNTYSLPYQTDVVLKATCSAFSYRSHADFIKSNTGHSVTFWESDKKNRMAIRSDMQSIIGYIDDAFIANQYTKTTMAGFIEDVSTDDNSKTIEVKLRFLMKKSVVNKNYLNSYNALKEHFQMFYDAGTYNISQTDLIKIVPRKSRSLSAYEPLVKYLKDYHSILLIIENTFKDEPTVSCFKEHASSISENVEIRQNASSTDNRNKKYISSSEKSRNSNKDSSSAITKFFPLWGITIGKTTWEQAEEKGYKVERWEKGPARVMTVGAFDFWDGKGEGVFTSAYISRNSYYLPPKWKSKGFSWNRSYDEWMNVFKNLGFTITVTHQPSLKVYSGRNMLSAQFEALSSDGTLLFILDFEFGEDGYLTSSPKTLNSIIVSYKGR